MNHSQWLLFLAALAPATLLQANGWAEAAQEKCLSGAELHAEASGRQEAHSLLQSKQDLKSAKAVVMEHPLSVAEGAEFEAPQRDTSKPAPSSAWSSLRGAVARLPELPTELRAGHGVGLLSALQVVATRLDAATYSSAYAEHESREWSLLSKVRQYFFFASKEAEKASIEDEKARQGLAGPASHHFSGPGAGGPAAGPAGGPAAGPAGGPAAGPARGPAAGPAGGPAGAMAPRGVLASLVSSLVYVVLAFAIAYIYVLFYRTEALDEGSPLKPPGIDSQSTGAFHFGICDCDGCCGRDLKICLCGWCCLGIRWADTLSQNKVRLGMSFWMLLMLNTLSFGLDQLTHGATTVAFIIFAIYCRQRLRRTFAMESGTCETICKDCLVWFFCFPCAAIQEAREVEYVALPISS